MPRRRVKLGGRSRKSVPVFSAVVQTVGLGMVIGSLLATLSFVFLQAYEQWLRR